MSSRYEDSRLLFIRRWGEMGANWGISRTMAEIHALLFVSSEPLCTDDVMDRLKISRGSASINLRQLVAWGLVYREHRQGDRKEYFVCETDVWQMFETITRERRRREVEPIIETVERCRAMIRDDLEQSQRTERQQIEQYDRRLAEMLEFLNLMNDLFNLVIRTGDKGLGPLSKMLAGLASP